MKHIKILSFSIYMVLMFAACEPEPVVPNQEELITTVIMTLTPTTGGSPLEFQFIDIDGDGGQPPITKFDTLSPLTTYNVEIQFLDQSQTPPEDITDEVRNEAEDHQIFFTPNNFELLKVTYADLDQNGKPIGLNATFETFSTKGKGIIHLTLIHKPNKSALNVATGDKTNAGGETDIEIFFPLIIK